jgi:hypothetical protein
MLSWDLDRDDFVVDETGSGSCLKVAFGISGDELSGSATTVVSGSKSYNAFQHRIWICTEGQRQISKILGITGSPTDIRAMHLPNTRLERCRYTNLLGDTSRFQRWSSYLVKKVSSERKLVVVGGLDLSMLTCTSWWRPVSVSFTLWASSPTGNSQYSRSGGRCGPERSLNVVKGTCKVVCDWNSTLKRRISLALSLDWSGQLCASVFFTLRGIARWIGDWVGPLELFWA